MAETITFKTPESPYLKPAEAAAFLGTNLRTLRRLPIARCEVTPAIIRYNVADLKKYRDRMPIPNDAEQMAGMIRRLAAEHRATGFIYFILCREVMKIGYTRSPKTRFGQLQEVIPFELRFLGSLPGSVDGEHAIHTAFAHRRVGNIEWFLHTPKILEAVALATADQEYAEETHG